MFLHEATYDLDELARFNLHCHTHYSNCAKREMTVENIIKEAERCGLEMLSLNDHILSPDELEQHFENNEQLRKEVEATGTKIKVLIGGEFSAYDTDKYTLRFADEKFKPDYRLYAANHYHVEAWHRPEDRSPDGFKEHMTGVLTCLFNEKAADCIAHPIYGGYSARFLDEKYGHEVATVGKAWSDNELGDIMQLGHESGCAWELNRGAVLGDPEFFRRMFNLGREIGVVFNFGTDAHSITDIDTRKNLDEVKRVLL